MRAHPLTCARSIRRQCMADDWPQPRIAQRIHDHCGVSPLRAHRLAWGWTLEEAVAKLRMIYAAQWGNEPALSHQRLSQWEIGADIPSARYLDTLCQLYASRPDRLGFGHDYTAGLRATAQTAGAAEPVGAATGGRGNDQGSPPQTWVPRAHGLVGGARPGRRASRPICCWA